MMNKLNKLRDLTISAREIKYTDARERSMIDSKSHLVFKSRCVRYSQVLAEELNCQPKDILNFELDVIDTQPSVIGGALKEFIFSGRLDNLCSSFCALKVSSLISYL